MGIVFFCQSCGARFEVDPRFAGKRGHCKRCGQLMSIPRAEEIASMAALPALVGAGVGAGEYVAGPADQAKSPTTGSWLKGGISNAVLAPITIDRMPMGYRKPTKPSPLDDAEDSKPYRLAEPVHQRRGSASPNNFAIVRIWRRQLGGIQKIFRKLNQTAYLFSIPFIMLLLVGAGVGNRPLALLGATGVVLLNIGRVVTGIANLAVVPFRDGINLNKMKKPLWRVIEPLLTIVAVFVAFTFIPWLSAGQSANGSITDRLRSGAQALKKDMKGEVGKVVDVDQLGERAQKTFGELKERASDLDVNQLGKQAQDQLKGFGSSSNGGSTRQSQTKSGQE